MKSPYYISSVLNTWNSCRFPNPLTHMNTSSKTLWAKCLIVSSPCRIGITGHRYFPLLTNETFREFGLFWLSESNQISSQAFSKTQKLFAWQLRVIRVGGLHSIPKCLPKAGQCPVTSLCLRKRFQSSSKCFPFLHIKFLIIIQVLHLLLHKMFIECLVCALWLGSAAEQTWMRLSSCT